MVMDQNKCPYHKTKQHHAQSTLHPVPLGRMQSSTKASGLVLAQQAPVITPPPPHTHTHSAHSVWFV